MSQPDASSEPTNAEPTLAAVLSDLLDCTELNMDDLEEHTRVVIQKARAALAAHP